MSFQFSIVDKLLFVSFLTFKVALSIPSLKMHFHLPFRFTLFNLIAFFTLALRVKFRIGFEHVFNFFEDSIGLVISEKFSRLAELLIIIFPFFVGVAGFMNLVLSHLLLLKSSLYLFSLVGFLFLFDFLISLLEFSDGFFMGGRYCLRPAVSENIGCSEAPGRIVHEHGIDERLEITRELTTCRLFMNLPELISFVVLNQCIKFVVGFSAG